MDKKCLPILTRAETKEAEAKANAAGLSYEMQMENAGRAAAETIEDIAKPHGKILLLCGSGNNAGDAFVLARIMAAKGVELSFLALGQDMRKKYSPLAALNLARLPQNVRQVDIDTAPWQADVIVDAVYGTGFHGALPMPVRRVFRKAAAMRGLRVALDVPSGLDCDSAQYSEDCFCASHTLCFGAYKPALLQESAKQFVGQVHGLDIGW